MEFRKTITGPDEEIPKVIILDNIIVENNTAFQTLGDMIENAEVIIEPASIISNIMELGDLLEGEEGENTENHMEPKVPEVGPPVLGDLGVEPVAINNEPSATIVEPTVMETERAEIEVETAVKKIVRKRLRRQEEWKTNIRARLCQSGKEYINVRGKKVDAKKVTNKKDCLNSCKFKCSRKIGETARNSLFTYYYDLNQNEKYVYLKQTTEKYLKGRKTVEQPSRRKFSFRYFFKVQEHIIQVCKQFFLGTLDISQKPIYTVHSVEPKSQKKDMRGKTGTQKKISNERKQVVIDHIRKFDVVESHYCRHNSERKYLEATLTIPKMYELYIEYCAEKNIDPVRMSMYRRIFSTNFNYGFHKPKKDVCENCFNYHLKKKENRLNDAERKEMSKHIAEKEAMRKEKDSDKISGTPVLCFDLENVITCPRSFVGNHFYFPKLTMYNLTGHLSTTKKAYCALWIETLQGRSGNCIASAFRKIVERVLEDNHVEELITWSDSCVPQNRNSHIAFCVLDILKNHPDLKSLTMKYSLPGHGCVQEVDNIHSQIERYMAQKEFFSPLSFMKELKQVNKKNPFIIMQMTEQDFKNFEECSKQLKYENIPFTKVCAMKFTNVDLTEICFKKSHLDEDFVAISINPSIPSLTRRRSKKIIQPKTAPEIANLIPKVLSNKKDISRDKIEAIKKMMICMPLIDQEFYKALLQFN